MPAVKAGGPLTSINNLARLLSENNIQPVVFTGIKDVDRSLLKVEREQFVRNKNAIVKYCRLLPDLVLKKEGIIYINEVFSLRFVFFPLFFSKKRIFIIAPRGSIHPEAMENHRLRKKVYLFFFKKLLDTRNVKFHATSISEEIEIKKIFGSKSEVLVIPNISSPFFTKKVSRKTKILRLTTISRISFIKSIAETLEALKLTKAYVHYAIYGFIEEKNYWKDCLRIVDQLPENVEFEYCGAVKQEDLQAVLHNADVYIQLSKSENYGHSIVNALNAGLPVITGKDIPWNELESFQAGINIDIETNRIVAAINFFASMSAKEFSKWQMGARSYYDKYIDDPSLKQQYLQMFQYPQQ